MTLSNPHLATVLNGSTNISLTDTHPGESLIDVVGKAKSDI
jgi:hypothetical protein